jgi:FkbM family methyltransferase
LLYGLPPMRGSLFLYRHFPRLMFLIRRIDRANYEKEMELLCVLCDPQRTSIDVGAKVGMYTYRIRKRSADVVAFEPIPVFNRMLRAVFRTRARIEPYAVSSARGTAVLRMPFDARGGNQFGRSTIEAGNRLASDKVARTEELEVETRTIDEYQLPSVGFVKIDVEGHELAVLDGAVRTLAANRPNLLIECNDDHQVDATGRLAAWLDAHDYDAVFVDGKTVRPIGEFRRDEHWAKHGIENFLCFHRSRPEVRDALVTALGGAPSPPAGAGSRAGQDRPAAPSAGS